MYVIINEDAQTVTNSGGKENQSQVVEHYTKCIGSSD